MKKEGLLKTFKNDVFEVVHVFKYHFITKGPISLFVGICFLYAFLIFTYPKFIIPMTIIVAIYYYILSVIRRTRGK